MKTEEIDKAILGVALLRWQKVAMVIVKTAQNLPELPQDDSGYKLVAKQIESLVATGALIAQGDIQQWRHSEVRISK
jgi:hypothetical protein